jgi:hypothetical protein
VAASVAVERPVPTPKKIDWHHLAELIDRHRVGALVDRSGWAVAHGAPSWLCNRLAARAQQTLREALSYLSVQRELVDALEAEGIPVLVLKGLPLSLDAYGDISARQIRDIDLLVAPERLEAAGRVLAECGLSWQGWGAQWEQPPADLRSAEPTALAYAERLPMLKHAEFERDGLIVELHWSLTGNRHLLPMPRSWLDEPRRVMVAGVSTPALPLVAAWRHLVVHGAVHEWLRLKWLADVPAMVSRHPELVSARALRAAEAEGLDRCVAAGLIVAERVFGSFLEPHARGWASRVSGTGPLVRGSIASLLRTHRSNSPAALSREVRQRLALRTDKRYRREEVRRMLLEAGYEWNAVDPGGRVLGLALGKWFVRRARRYLRAA